MINLKALSENINNPISSNNNVKNNNKTHISFMSGHKAIFNTGLNEDKFVRSIVAFNGSENKAPLLSQNLTEYPINQFYVLLLDKDFINGKGRHNNFGSVYEDEDIFFQWFAEKSKGVLKNKLPQIDIDGPTGARTIWKVMNDKSRAHELIPLYIMAADWYYNNDNITHPRFIKANQQVAISLLESDMKVDLSEYKDKDYKYKEYILSKKDFVEKQKASKLSFAGSNIYKRLDKIISK